MVSITASVLNLVAVISLIDLIRFHRFLHKKDISTFDWIRFKREREVKKNNLSKEKYDLWEKEFFEKNGSRGFYKGKVIIEHSQVTPSDVLPQLSVERMRAQRLT